jgi:peptidoglycan/LPS O-acetylase OafA/YrhL
MLVTLGYVANWYQVRGHAVAPGFEHVWSLSVEEQFYLLWPLVTVAILTYRRSTAFIVGCFVAAVAAIVVWRIHVWVPNTSFFAVPKFHYRTDMRADAILIGALTAHLWTRRKTPTAGLRVMATVALAFIVVCLFQVRENSNFLYDGGFVLIAVATSLIILAVVDGRWFFGRMFDWAPLRAVGRVSYGLYLWHLPVFVAVARYTVGWPAWLRTSIAIATTAICTVASYYFVERPFLRRKDAMSRRQMRLAAGSATS